MSWAAAKAADPRAVGEVCCAVGVALLAHLALCYCLVRRYWPAHPRKLELADLFAASLRNWALIIPAFVGVVELRHDRASRWLRVSDASAFLLIVYAMWNALHVFVLLLNSSPFRDKVSMLLHHTVSVWSTSLLYFSQQMHWFACLAGCAEITNVFLNFLYLCKEVPAGNGKLQDKIPQWMYVGNGVLLWLSFAVFRMALFPYLLFTMYTDAHEAPAETWDHQTPLRKFLCVTANSFLFVLSAMWFVPISKGLFKHVFQLCKADGKSRKND